VRCGKCRDHESWCILYLHRLAIGRGLWETICMATIKTGQIVEPDGLVGVYRVVSISADGQTADIEKFDVATKKSVGDPVRAIAMNKLTPYTEDRKQAAARVVREAVTED